MPSVHTIKISETTSVIVLNAQTSIKLTHSNYPTWKVQFNSLMVRYDLLGFVDGTKNGPTETHTDYTYWKRQDQLILLAIINSSLDDVDLVIHTLSGLGPEFKEIFVALRTRENPIEFNYLHDLLIDYESHLKRDEDISPIDFVDETFKGKPYYPKQGRTSNHNNSFQQNRSTSPGSSKRITCQCCDKVGHKEKVCYS